MSSAWYEIETWTSLDSTFPKRKRVLWAKPAEATGTKVDADRLMRSAMSRLFREEPDVREVIKLKAVYELLETITDKCEDVANLIEGIVLENS